MKCDENGLLQIYYKEIKRYPRLSQEEERALCSRVESGDYEAVNLLVIHNLRLSVKEALRFWRRNSGRGIISVMDLVTEGNIGLIRAAQKFNGEVRFSSYATWWIRHFMQRWCEQNTTSLSVSYGTSAHLYQYLRFRYQYKQDHGIFPTDEQVIKGTHWSKKKLEKVKTLFYLKEVRLDHFVDEDGASVAPPIVDETAVSPETFVENDNTERITKETMEDLIGYLPKREQEIIKRRYGIGIGIGKEMTLEKVGRRIGLTRERIRQIEAKAMNRLKMLAEKMGVRNLLR